MLLRYCLRLKRPSPVNRWNEPLPKNFLCRFIKYSCYGRIPHGICCHCTDLRDHPCKNRNLLNVSNNRRHFLYETILLGSLPQFIPLLTLVAPASVVHRRPQYCQKPIRLYVHPVLLYCWHLDQGHVICVVWLTPIMQQPVFDSSFLTS